MLDILSALGITYNFSYNDYLEMTFSELREFIKRAEQIAKNRSK